MNQKHVIHHMSIDDLMSSHAGEQVYVEAGQQTAIYGDQVRHVYFATARFIDGDDRIHCYHPFAEELFRFISDDTPPVKQAAEKLRLKAEQAGGRLFYYLVSSYKDFTPRRGLIDIGGANIVGGEQVPDLAGMDDR